MAGSFDVNDRNSWYFGPMSRQEATDLLMNEREGGVFLIRDSTTIVGDFVLCVREDSKVSHYIINKIPQNNQVVYRIGDQCFPDLPDLLSFYKLHYLDTTPLRRPVHRKLEIVVGKFDFEGSDQDDLPFRKGELLYIINKDEEQWWTARNEKGQIGQIPVPYIQKLQDNRSNSIERQLSTSGVTNNSSVHQSENTLKKNNLNRKLPALARVKQARVPNAYDRTALRLEVGDTIKVTKTNINGQWEGIHMATGKTGHFPFTHVEFIDNENENEEQQCTDPNCPESQMGNNWCTDAKCSQGY
uniref:CSON013326 protein n=1 Tax=Culicoides sonorensis TaxID=179676 RepID=A0A336KM49_CULSO